MRFKLKIGKEGSSLASDGRFVISFSCVILEFISYSGLFWVNLGFDNIGEIME